MQIICRKYNNIIYCYVVLVTIKSYYKIAHKIAFKNNFDSYLF